MVVVGKITEKTKNLLNLNSVESEKIYLGTSNITHMKQRHPYDYAKYGQYINTIVNSPDYVGLNSKDSSIEFVKEFKSDGEYVKVAVRVSKSGKNYARSIYVLNNNRVANFIAKGTLKKC